MEHGTAEILFRPICSKCKHILYEEIDYIEYPVAIGDYKGMLMNNFTITPQKCPYCNAPFERIEIPTKLPFRNEGYT